MTFDINDPNLLLQQAGNLEQKRQSIYSAKSNLYEQLQKVSQNWDSDTIDQDTYLKGLNYDLSRIENLNGAISRLAAVLRNYANQAIKAANEGN